jgi:4-hydroxyphenylpyruvate dioxygenase
MANVEPIGMKRLLGIHYYVHDLERSRRFYTEMLDFAETAASGEELERAGRQRSALFEAGEVQVLCSAPLGEGGRAWRFLRKHPDGVGTLVFEVEDADRAFRLLEERGATPIADVQRWRDEAGSLASFSITTPFGDTTFRFLERRGFRAPFPGMVRHPRPLGGANAFGFERIDHVTSNFQTMKPALLWLEHVMGFEEFWEVQFHTSDVARERRARLEAAKGSGLRSVVMRDPRSGVKFANNEPWRPSFKSSQVNVFVEELRGDGVQHAALAVKDILSAVPGMRRRGVEFLPTLPAYYEMLPERLRETGVGGIEEDIATLRDLQVLVDGQGKGRYLLQIFLKDSAGLYREPAAGPFFFEVIQRKGDEGFGAGNFRALFESIEREQEKGSAA